MIEHLNLKSTDGTQLLLDQLRRVAPSVFTETTDPNTGKTVSRVDFDALRQLLGDMAADSNDEMYRFTWPGKGKARAEAAKPIDKTLRPVPEDSVDWDMTKNLYIEGDNLDVLKLLQRSYLGKVKMIYIDPPYNTGNDFVYDDDFSRTAAEEELAAGDVDELGLRYRRNTDSNGRFHSDWCSMIYPRLLVARSLLTEDGVIFISIDDHEVENLKKICNEVYGESNFIGVLSVENNPKGRKNSSFISVSSEYCVIYAKNKTHSFFLENIPKRASDMILDEDGKYVHGSGKRVLVGENSFNKNVSNPLSEKNYSVYYNAGKHDLIIKKELYQENDKQLQKLGYVKYFSHNKGKLVENTYTETRFKELFADKALQFSKDKIYEKNFNDTVRIKSQLINREYEAIVKGCKRMWSMDLTTTGAGTYLKNLFNMEEAPFPASKNLGFLKILITLFSKNDITILDFFSGSSSTADAIMRLNSEDGGNRQFIMVQLPELTDKESVAYKAGYKNICEIGKERIRRAGKKIKEESPLTTQDLDTGFRVFRLDESNYAEVSKSPSEYSQDQLSLFENNIKADRTDLDLLFGAMLAWGVTLDLPMTAEKVDGCTIYTVNEGDLVACFAEGITDGVVAAMAAHQPLRILFRDSCFTQDAQKINIYEQFKQAMDWTDDEAMKNIKVI